jgi:uncharacterized protein YjbI with pentapeptide repeats
VVGSALAVIGVVGIILYQGYMTRPGWVGVADKKFWDYLDLLIVPAAIAMGVALINWMQGDRERRDEDARQRREVALQDQRAQDDALQAYLDHLTQLLVTQREHELIRRQVEDDVRQVIQARSEALLRILNPTRRFSLIIFLSVMGLLLAGKRPLVSLAGADLRSVNGQGAPLEGADLKGADLSGADLSRAGLSDANLSNANLSGANLSYAVLIGADLTEANLKKANIWYEANLSRANLTRADLRGAELIRGIHLDYANLDEADLREAVLTTTMDLRDFFRRAAPLLLLVQTTKPGKPILRRLTSKKPTCRTLRSPTSN